MIVRWSEKNLEEARTRKKPYSMDHRIVLPDGTEKQVHEQGEMTFDETGAPIRMRGTVQDISERAKAREVEKRIHFHRKP